MTRILKATDEQIELYLSGKKAAVTRLVVDLEKSGEALPQVGDLVDLVDSDGRSRAILRTVKVVVQSFDCVKEDIPEAEGEGSLESWQKSRRELFAPSLKGLGISDLDPAEVITEFFARSKVP